MAPFMAEAVSALERFGELSLTDHQRVKLTAMSAPPSTGAWHRSGSA
jgi:hypothetical protein